jgi:hypothetical protein
MRVWTMILSLMIAVAIVATATAQDKKEGKRGGPRVSFKDMVGSDDGKLTEDLYVKGRTKNAPDDKKEAATTRAKDMWKRIAGDKKELTKDEYEAAMKKVMEEFKGKRGQKKDK